MNLSDKIVTERVANYAAAANSTANGSISDLAGFEGVRYVVAAGAISADGSLVAQVQAGDVADGSDMTDVAGLTVTFGDGDDNKLAVLELQHPGKRYARCEVTTVLAAINSVVAEKFGAKKQPTTDDATTVEGRVTV